MTEDNVKARIVELIPEIMELKFGTLVRFQRAPNVILHGQVVSAEHANDKVSLLLEISTTVYQWPRSAIIEILGRPITLADVLRTLQKVRCDEAIGIDYNGGFLNCDQDMQNLTTSDTCWNLLTDYDNQTPELKAFIGTLLGCG